ncbi:MAG: amidohydrolase, partial [Bacteroidota bacterium]
MDKIVSITVIKYILGCLLLLPFLGQAQNVPASLQTEGVVISNVTLHIGNGKVIERGAIAFNDGKIVYAGASAGWNGNEEFKQVDGAGKHVYPALIAPNTQLGLIEIGAVRATRD